MDSDSQGDVTILLRQMRGGDSDALEKMIPLVLHELRTIARHYLRTERAGHTLQPTALVNEAYLRLVSDQARDWQNRAHFVGVTASIMRRILVDYARRRRALKRNVELQSPEDEFASLSYEQAEELLTLNTALDSLEKRSPRQRQVIELRYFGGLTLEETAEALDVSLITVRRDWLAARAWLKLQIQSIDVES